MIQKLVVVGELMVIKTNRLQKLTLKWNRFIETLIEISLELTEFNSVITQPLNV